MLNKTANSIFKILIEIFIFDKKKRSYAKAGYAKRKLRKYIDAAVPGNVIPQPEYQDEKIIWQYWHDGAKMLLILSRNVLQVLKRIWQNIDRLFLTMKQ